MNKIIFSLVLTFISFLSVLGQDIIALKNGDIIQAIVSDITQTEIKYKKYSNQTGPTYTVDKSDVLSILFSNGEKEVFNSLDKNNTTAPSQSSSGPIFIAPIAAADNEDIKSAYSSVVASHQNKTPNTKKLKTTEYGWPILGFTPESILSDSIITISFELAQEYYIFCDGDWGFSMGKKLFIESEYYTPSYKIVIKNKSNNIIYVDVANCFRNISNGESFLNSITVAQTSSNSAGAGINLGSVTNALGVGGVIGTLANGIGIGGNKSNSITVTENEERIISIPPHGSKVLPQKIYLNSKKNKSTKNYEFLYGFIPTRYKKKIELWSYMPVEYNAEDCPTGPSYLITYSTHPDFNQYTSISFTLCVCGILGVGHSTSFKDLKFNTSHYLVGRGRVYLL